MRNWPKTLEEAVAELKNEFGKEEIDKIKKMKRNEFDINYLFLGQYIRNQFGLWAGNKELLHNVLPNKPEPDNVSQIIIEKLFNDVKKEREMEKIIENVRKDYSDTNRFLKIPHIYELIKLNPRLKKKSEDEIDDLVNIMIDCGYVWVRKQNVFYNAEIDNYIGTMGLDIYTPESFCKMHNEDLLEFKKILKVLKCLRDMNVCGVLDFQSFL